MDKQEKDYIVRRGTPDDYEDIIDFGNYVFHTDFAVLLPKLYKSHPERAAEHLLVTENRAGGERIRGMSGLFPIPVTVCGRKLKGAGVGTVSVHPYDRGKGYMKEAVGGCVRWAEAEGYDFVILSGRKQRYQHYGFEKCGSIYNFDLAPSVSHQLRKFGVEGITPPVSPQGWEVLTSEAGRAYEQDCRALYEAQPVWAERADFWEVASSWSGTVRVLLHEGQFAGYAALSLAYGGYTVHELVLRDGVDPMGAVLAILDLAVEKGARELTVSALPFQQPLLHTLTLIAEEGRLSSPYGVDVLHYAPVAEAFLQLKADMQPLPEGSYTFGVQRGDSTEKVRLSLYNGQAKAEVMPEDAPADIVLSHLQMTDFLFAVSGTMGVSGRQPALEKAWFPLPLCLSEEDNS